MVTRSGGTPSSRAAFSHRPIPLPRRRALVRAMRGECELEALPDVRRPFSSRQRHPMSRVLRLPGTWHSGAARQVTVVAGTGERHDFEELARTTCCGSTQRGLCVSTSSQSISRPPSQGGRHRAASQARKRPRKRSRKRAGFRAGLQPVAPCLQPFVDHLEDRRGAGFVGAGEAAHDHAWLHAAALVVGALRRAGGIARLSPGYLAVDKVGVERWLGRRGEKRLEGVGDGLARSFVAHLEAGLDLILLEQSVAGCIGPDKRAGSDPREEGDREQRQDEVHRRSFHRSINSGGSRARVSRGSPCHRGAVHGKAWAAWPRPCRKNIGMRRWNARLGGQISAKARWARAPKDRKRSKAMTVRGKIPRRHPAGPTGPVSLSFRGTTCLTPPAEAAPGGP